jgi:CrcB protein
VIGVAEAAAGGIVGAPARFVVDQLVTARTGSRFPWGTFVVNATGGFVLGLLAGLATHHHIGPVPSTVMGSGFCGAYTTFSTFSYESIYLLEEGTPGVALLNIAGSLAVGLLAAAAGMALAAFT